MKKMSAKKMSEKIYEEFVGHDIWEEAYRTYPEYNDCGEDTESAVELLLNFMLDNTQLEQQVQSLNEKDETILRDGLYESIYAGLT